MSLLNLAVCTVFAVFQEYLIKQKTKTFVQPHRKAGGYYYSCSKYGAWGEARSCFIAGGSVLIWSERKCEKNIFFREKLKLFPYWISEQENVLSSSRQEEIRHGIFPQGRGTFRGTQHVSSAETRVKAKFKGNYFIPQTVPTGKLGTVSLHRLPEYSQHFISLTAPLCMFRS